MKQVISNTCHLADDVAAAIPKMKPSKPWLPRWAALDQTLAKDGPPCSTCPKL